ncbi:MAG TPA: NADH-quinone oxidoreductase subunit I [Deltaproteobacteria bacterium]|nr:NADH-quinone oxidoreductase subunit I [Deltaproteobacteria bacterium]
MAESALGHYFQNIKVAAKSIFEGLTITFSHMIRKPVTLQYPDKTPRPVTELMPERSRSWLRVEMDICTACLMCETSCPIDCIKISVDKNSPKGRAMSGFDIDMAKCMYCGLCTEPCPTGAIHFVPEFERAAYSLEEMVSHFVSEGDYAVPYKPPKKEKSSESAEPSPQAGEESAPSETEPAVGGETLH